MAEPYPNSAVLVAAPYPPPVHGFAVIMSSMADMIAMRVPVTRVNLAAERPSRIATHFAQTGRCLAGCAAIVRHHRKKGRITAIGVNGGLGLIYTIALAATARICRQRILLHHHTYRYINHRSRLISLLLLVSGARATHVFLSEIMNQAFISRYACRIRHEILNNAIFVPPVNRSRVKNLRPIAGLISNLAYEKGLHDFLALAKRCKEEGIAMDFILAGPVKLESDLALIKAAVTVGEVIWRGPLYGEEKQAFFAEIDILVFPTRYELEAQPTIIYEAFAAGTPALSIDRGAIRDQIGDCLTVIGQDEDFVSAAIPVLQQIAASDAIERQALSNRAQALHAANTHAGEAALQRLFWSS